jgi:hypothetical protein
MRRLGITRRELLTGGLAVAGAALTGCGGSRPGAGQPDIAGEIVGGSHQLGHLLRGGLAFPSASRTERVAVVIVGGGVAGLAAAWHFRQVGFRDFILLELEDSPGGNARAATSSVTPYPWGAHYLPLPGPEAKQVRRLLTDLGVIERFDRAGWPVYVERYLCHAPQERLFIHGRWQEGIFPHTGAREEDLAQYRAFRKSIDAFRKWRDGAGRRAFAIPRLAGAPAAFRELDRVSMADFLDSRGWNSPRLRWYVEYACRDDFGTSLAETSAWAGVHYYASRDPDPEYGDVVLTWPEGNGWLTQRMAAAAREQIRVGQAAFNVEPSGRAIHVDVYDPKNRASLRLTAREVILACPVFVAARIYRPWRDRPPSFVPAFRYAPWLVANLHLSTLPADGPGAPLAWDNVIYESESLGYVVATHQSLRTHHAGTVWTYYLPFPGRDPGEMRRDLLATPWASFRDRILADLSRPHPEIGGSVRRLDVMLYGHAMVRPEVGFVCGEALASAVTSLDGPVHLAHSDLSGFSLFEEAYEWGNRAARRVLRRIGRA